MSKRIKIKIVRRYSEALKRQVVEEFESGRSSAKEAVEEYGIENKRTVYRWVRKYGRNRTQTKIIRVIMKDEKERIKELEGALAESTIKNRVLEEMLKVYEETQGGTIKKSSIPSN